jgi:hypothetical protein
MSVKRFTLAEANSVLNIIRPVVAEIQSIRERILARQPELWLAMERAGGNGGSAELSRLAHEFDRLDSLAHEIVDTGAEIKDLGIGLIDFRALRDDQEVYLCWKYGEEDIRYWHEIGAGVAGRRPIELF